MKSSSSYGKIDVVGIACRAPGALNPSELWNMLLKGVDHVVSKAPQFRGSFAGGYMSDVFGFDNTFFGISLAEANNMNLSQVRIMQCRTSIYT